jgi:soluble lytic murein transglycosylase-like protein
MNILTALFITTSTQFGLPPNLLSSLCYVESTHKVNAVHHDDGGSDSLGICQIKFETSRWLGFKGTAKQLMNPKINIYYAGKYLARNIKRYNGQIEKAVIAYNKGSAGSLVHTKYSQKVFTNWRYRDAISSRR